MRAVNVRVMTGCEDHSLRERVHCINHGQFLRVQGEGEGIDVMMWTSTRPLSKRDNGRPVVCLPFCGEAGWVTNRPLGVQRSPLSLERDLSLASKCAVVLA